MYFFFQFFKGDGVFRENLEITLLLYNIGRKVSFLNDVRIFKDKNPFDRVFKLSDIAGPGVFL